MPSIVNKLRVPASEALLAIDDVFQLDVETWRDDESVEGAIRLVERLRAWLDDLEEYVYSGPPGPPSEKLLKAFAAIEAGARNAPR